MIAKVDLQHHLKCKEGDVGRYVLLPGDPGRVEMIASRLDRFWPVAQNREYVTYSGLLDNELVSITSTGIGGPSAAIAVEELSRLGADTFIRVGTAGGLQPFVEPGDLVVAQAAVRDEGTSRWYLPIEFPAVASYDVVEALAQACTAQGNRHHVGVVHSKDSFYGQREPERMPVAQFLTERWAAWTAGGALVSEMECASIFTVSAYLHRRRGAIVKVMSNKLLAIPRPDSIDNLIELSVDALRRLIARDRVEAEKTR